MYIYSFIDLQSQAKTVKFSFNTTTQGRTMFNRLLIAAAFAMIPTLGFAWDQKPNMPVSACAAQIPYGLPTTNNGHQIVIECHTAYILAEDTVAKIPAWVSYTLTPAHAMGCLARVNAFATDNILPPGQRSEPKDYDASGYDKGHLANDADMSWDPQVQNESFLMSNMSPQTPATNRGIWKVLETSVRAWAYVNKVPYTIYAGNISGVGATPTTIGANNVVVPDFLYKIVINDQTKEVQAYIFPNLKTDQGHNIAPFLTSVDKIERNTGITFPLPPGADKTTVASAPWPVDVRTLDSDKKTVCKSN